MRHNFQINETTNYCSFLISGQTVRVQTYALISFILLNVHSYCRALNANEAVSWGIYERSAEYNLSALPKIIQNEQPWKSVLFKSETI